MIDLSVAKLKVFSLSEESTKKVFLDSWVKFRRLEVREKVRNVFVTSLLLSDHEVLHDIASVLIKFFRFRSDDLLAFFAHISYFLNFWSLKEFNKTIIPFALVGYETGYSHSALCASLAIYHLISNARSWNNC